MQADSPIDPNIYRLLELFRGELAEVRFPEVDREVLESLAGEVTAQHERAQALRAELSDAEERLAAARTALLDRAGAGLAYARLYAERHPELGEKLAGIALAPAAKRGRKPRKPRAVKSSGVEAEASAQRRPRRMSAEPAAPLEAVG